jgi:hypothetical protein
VLWLASICPELEQTALITKSDSKKTLIHKEEAKKVVFIKDGKLSYARDGRYVPISCFRIVLTFDSPLSDVG